MSFCQYLTLSLCSIDDNVSQMTENISLDADSNTNQFMLPYKILMFIYAAIVLIQAP